MNHRTPYKPDTPAAERMSHVQIMVNGRGRNLWSGQEITLWPGAGRKQSQRFRFDWATTDPGGHLVLEIYGPLGRRRPPSYRCIAPSEIKVVHNR